MKFIIISIILAVSLFFIYSYFAQNLAIELFTNPESFALGNYSFVGTILISSGATHARVGMGDKVDIGVVKNRWYGKIVEAHGKETTFSTLKLFGLVELPLQINESNWAKYHFMAGFVALILVLFGFITDKIYKGGYQYEERN